MPIIKHMEAIMEQTFFTLEFHSIINQLEQLALTNWAKKEIKKLKPYLSEREVKYHLKETQEAKLILEHQGNPPIVSLSGLDEILETAKKEGCLMAEQLEYLQIILVAVKRLKQFLCQSKSLSLSLPYYEENLDSMEELREELNQKIRNGQVDDFATKQLKEIRSEIEKVDTKMRSKAESMLKSKKNFLSDQFVTMKNNHLCLPVKREYKLQISGNIIDKSSTGATLFIEPTQIAAFYEQIQILKIEEENEVRKILYQLTEKVTEKIELFLENKRIIEKLDFIFAKGKLSCDLDAIEPHINTEGYITIKNGRHPLLDKEICVPLNFSIGEQKEKKQKGVIITGPNTGGKTVAIKTVGLLCIMAQSGLHIPCDMADICLTNQILCDIGDGQNITENLSTFSAHIKNTLFILKKANKDSLVIMDELGSGTDPTEGMGIAIAILEELRKSGCLYVVTTHYPEIKQYASQTEGVVNARMTFDKETLKPLYQMEIGKAGESCAFYIAKKLGMPETMLRCANRAAYHTEQLPFEMGKDTFVKEKQLQKEYVPSIQKEKKEIKKSKQAEQFQIGDSVIVYPHKKIGIVCRTVNEKGMLQIQLAGKKIWVNHKRVKIRVKAKELYPEDYDFSIVFDSVEVRKARHQMERKYCKDLEIIEKEEN